jgi:NhaP-type Na+/H+ or K+/H+ antiporter
VTLAVVLFTDATKINASNWRAEAFVPGRLLTWGLPLTVLFGAAVAAVMFTSLGIWEAALIGAILAPTDAALGQAVVTNPRVPQRIRQALNVESGLNDGIALPLVLVFLAAAEETSQGGGSLGGLLSFLGQEILVAAAIGIVFGWLGSKAVIHANNRQWISHTWLQIGALALAVAAYGLAVPLGGSGFIAAWLTGLTLGAATRGKVDELSDFSESLGSVLTMASFFVFGAILLGPALGSLTWQIAVYAILTLAVLRGVAVAASMIGSDLRPATVLFMGWFGPRGLASIIFAGLVVEDAVLPGSNLIVTLTMVTVGLSIYAHGTTSWFGSESYGRWHQRQQEDEQPSDHPAGDHRPEPG